MESIRTGEGVFARSVGVEFILGHDEGGGEESVIVTRCINLLR